MRPVQVYTIYAGAFIFLPFVAICLRLFGLKKTCRIFRVKLALKQGDETGTSHQGSRQDAEQLYLIVHRVARRLPWKLECLPRSVAICILLRWIGEFGVLRISVKKNDVEIEAHAWVEHSNATLGEQDPLTKGLYPLS
ncbi:MAG: lasso peptide biosynthesis B2 protein [Verrucomicrobia bacterium]|jgi:hypothetical protein|nr:lasso peptide biosynthesis B2 protein [Verrucomicrobiota bacterium]